MKKNFTRLISLFFLLCGWYRNSFAQLPNCTNIYLDEYLDQIDASGAHTSSVPTGKLYTFDPTAPVSATNPSLNAISLPPDYFGGLTVSEVLNSGNLTQTFYCVTRIPTGQLKYSYYDPLTSNWVNTGHNPGPPNIAAGGNGIIYSLNIFGRVYKYDGTGDATVLMDVPDFLLEGPLDLIADCEGNWYIINFTGNFAPPFLRKYSPTGVLLESWTISNPNNYQMIIGGGFAIINNTIYVDVAIPPANTDLGMAYATLTPGNISFNNITSALPNNVVVPSGNGTATQHIFSDLGSCSGAIPTYASITVTASPNAICARTNVNYTTSVTHGGNAQYQWFVNGVAIPGATGSTFSYITNMNDQVTCELTSSLACVTNRVVMSAPAVIDIVDGAIPALGYLFSKICVGEALQTDPILARPQNGTFSVSPATGLNVNTSTGHIDFNNATPGNYTITYTTKGNANCPSKSISVPMSVIPQPYVKIDVDGKLSSLCDGSEVHLSTPYYPNTTYDWWPDHFFTDSFFENAITATFPEGNNTVSVYVTDSNGCIGRDTVLITLEPCCKFDMPNAFTPNGDGRNDYFAPVSITELNVTDFSIYNRWGQLVYKGFGREVRWDGKLKGKDMAQGIYNYIIEFKCDGKQYSKKGDINLIR